MTRGAFEKRWTLYGGWLQVLLNNGTWPRSCSELPMAILATSESMRKDKAPKIAIFCAVALRDQL